MYAWGDDTYGELGDGNSGTQQNSPELISGASTITQVNAGGCALHTLAIFGIGFLLIFFNFFVKIVLYSKKGNGNLYAWGYNNYGLFFSIKNKKLRSFFFKS